MGRVVLFDRAEKILANEAWDAWVKANKTTGRRAIQRATPVDLGGLKGSVNYRILPRRGPLGTDVLRYETKAHYAASVHQGHGEIVPVNASVLSWLNRLTGERVFAMRVGPLAANPFIVNGLRSIGLRVKQNGTIVK